MLFDENGEITDDYIREVNAAYWAEIDEMENGIHPLQIGGTNSISNPYDDSNWDGE